jgi:diguanylate cyclase (GGDEF)-like protein
VTGSLGVVAALLALGGVVVWTGRREQAVRRDAGRLLEAGVALTSAAAEGEAAGVLVGIARELLDADVAVLMLAEAPGATRFVVRAGARAVTRLGPPPAAIAPVEDVGADAGGVGLAVRCGRVVRARDGRARELWSAGVDRDTAAEAAVFVPVIGEGGVLGVVVAAWARRPHHTDVCGTRALALLVPQAARVLERLRRSERLEVAAETDALTGLANRRGFDRVMTRLRPGDALVVCDLDHFKAVNDNHGHAVGDELLGRFGALVRSVVRRHDAAGRLGGEEFVILLADVGDEDGARRVVDRLRHRWVATRPLATFSAGVAVCDAVDDPTDVLRRADEALYAAKRAGRDRIVGEREHAGAPL